MVFAQAAGKQTSALTLHRDLGQSQRVPAGGSSGGKLYMPRRQQGGSRT